MKLISLMILMILMILMTSCSESTEFFNKNKKTNFSLKGEEKPIATPEELIQGPILLDGGLTIKSDGTPTHGVVNIKNIDPKHTYIIEYKLEKEEVIQLKNPVLKEQLKGQGVTQIPILFNPGKLSEIKVDNLMITYYRNDAPEEKRTIMYPIRGESTVQVDTSHTPELVSSISVKTVSGADALDFGKTIIGEAIDGKVIITNTGLIPVRTTIRIERNDILSIKDQTSCPEILDVGKNCTLSIVFDSKKAGIHQDDLIVEHGSTEEEQRRVTLFPLIGIKLEDLQKCGEEPCAAPFKEGVLVASDVFSNDIDFGSISIGSEIKKQIEIQNKGDIPLKVRALLSLSSSVFSFAGGTYPGVEGTCGDIILPGSCIMEVVYRPIRVGHDVGSLKLKTTEGHSISLELSGKGSESRSCDTFNEYLIVPEKSFPASEVIFPYLLSHPQTKAKLSHLYGTQVNSFVQEINDHTVKDGMVFLTFKLPEMEGEIINMNFGVNVYKVIRDNYKDTESLCLSSESIRKCSGQEFSLASWQRLKNPAFWNIFKAPINQRYEEQLSQGENKCGSKNCMSLNTQYELKDIFDLGADEFATLRKKGLFSLIFSDDTRMLTMPRIYIKTKTIKACN